VVDKLKQALEQLEQPICPACHIEMRWTRSALVASDTIAHLFHCPNCYRTSETSSKVNTTVIPPEKLSAPFRERAA
jgi:hypothetical protein